MVFFEGEKNPHHETTSVDNLRLQSRLQDVDSRRHSKSPVPPTAELHRVRAS